MSGKRDMKIKPKAEEDRFPLWGQELQQHTLQPARSGDRGVAGNPRPSPPQLAGASATERGPPAHLRRLERPRRTAGRRTSGCASPLAHCWASEPACASLGSGGPQGEGEWGRTPEGGGRASSELTGPRGGRRGPGSARQRGRAARCPGLAVATGRATQSPAHAAPK